MEWFTSKRRWLTAVSGGLVLCLLLSLCGLYGQCEGVRDSVVRLHILANSDSEADQALKLRVRDAVVEAAAGWLDTAATTEEALAQVTRQLPQLEQVARQTVAAEGYAYPVTARLCEAYFPTRQYGDITLPAGRYQAVQIAIGAAEGQNWWCVVYPPLCAGSATNRRQLSDVLTTPQQQLVQGGGYVVKFKIVEWVEGILRFFR